VQLRRHQASSNRMRSNDDDHDSPSESLPTQPSRDLSPTGNEKRPSRRPSRLDTPSSAGRQNYRRSFASNALRHPRHGRSSQLRRSCLRACAFCCLADGTRRQDCSLLSRCTNSCGQRTRTSGNTWRLLSIFSKCSPFCFHRRMTLSSCSLRSAISLTVRLSTMLSFMTS